MVPVGVKRQSAADDAPVPSPVLPPTTTFPDESTATAAARSPPHPGVSEEQRTKPLGLNVVSDAPDVVSRHAMAWESRTVEVPAPMLPKPATIGAPAWSRVTAMPVDAPASVRTNAL